MWFNPEIMKTVRGKDKKFEKKKSQLVKMNVYAFSGRIYFSYLRHFLSRNIVTWKISKVTKNCFIAFWCVTFNLEFWVSISEGAGDRPWQNRVH